MFKILITSRLFGKIAKQPLQMLLNKDIEIVSNPYPGKTLTEDELCELIEGVNALIVGPDQVSKKVIDRGDDLKIVAVHGVGIDNIDLAAASKHGIFVTNAPGTNKESVADLVFGLLIGVSRKIYQAHHLIINNKWENLIGYELSNKTIGLVGFGSIGRAVAQRALGFDMNVLVFDPYLSQSEVLAPVSLVSFEKVLQDADFVSLHLPLNEKTQGMIGAKELSLMKENAILINTARGGLVDTDELIKHLKTGKIAGAGIDVFEPEPPNQTICQEFKLLDNILTSPHIGAFTFESLNRTGMTVVNNVLAAYNGEIPTNLVNKGSVNNS